MGKVLIACDESQTVDDAILPELWCKDGWRC